MDFPVSKRYHFARIRQAESMDDPGLDPAIHQVALEGLETISTWPGQREPILREILALARGRRTGPSTASLATAGRKGRRLRIVELGAGSGHLSAWLGRKLVMRGILADVIATDLKPGPGVMALDVADERAFPEADLFVSNLMWHHLPNEVLAGMIRAMTAKAQIGWLGYDLHRSVLHYYGGLAAMRLAGLHPILLSDGSRSIQQGFKLAELRRLCLQAGCGTARIGWHFPFRWMVSYSKI